MKCIYGPVFFFLRGDNFLIKLQVCGFCPCPSDLPCYYLELEPCPFIYLFSMIIKMLYFS